MEGSRQAAVDARGMFDELSCVLTHSRDYVSI